MRRLCGTSNGWGLGLVGAFLALMVVSLAFADDGGTFSLQGNAVKLPYGLRPDGSVELTSDCTFTGSPPKCDFSTITFSNVVFTPSPNTPLTLADIPVLSSDFNVGGSDCGGGSPRFTISLNTGNNIFVYFGPVPNFTSCFFGWQNTGNVVLATDTRWDTSQVPGGTFYDTHTDALTLAGSTPVTSVAINVDGGWMTPRGQDVLIDNFTVNNKVMKGGNVH